MRKGNVIAHCSKRVPVLPTPLQSRRLFLEISPTKHFNKTKTKKILNIKDQKSEENNKVPHESPSYNIKTLTVVFMCFVGSSYCTIHKHHWPSSFLTPKSSGSRKPATPKLQATHHRSRRTRVRRSLPAYCFDCEYRKVPKMAIAAPRALTG